MPKDPLSEATHLHCSQFKVLSVDRDPRLLICSSKPTDFQFRGAERLCLDSCHDQPIIFEDAAEIPTPQRGLLDSSRRSVMTGVSTNDCKLDVTLH